MDQKHPPPELLASVPRPAQLQAAAAPGGSRREGLSLEQPTGAGPRRLPRRRRGGRPAPPCGRGGSRAANVTRRRRLTHPVVRSRAASRAGRPAMGPRDRAPGSRGTKGAGAGVCVRACLRARPPWWLGGGRFALRAPPPRFRRDSVGGSVEKSLSVTGSPHTQPRDPGTFPWVCKSMGTFSVRGWGWGRMRPRVHRERGEGAGPGKLSRGSLGREAG